MAGQWSRSELEKAFLVYQETVERAAQSGDWNLFVDLFTPDADYIEHMYGTFHGHDQIRAWITNTMGTFPGNRMPGFPIAWSVVDEERGWIVCEIRNLMVDPGDGGAHEASNITILKYAGDNRWASEEDVYNPLHFRTMVIAWARSADAHGTLSDDDRASMDSMMPGWSRAA